LPSTSFATTEVFSILTHFGNSRHRSKDNYLRYGDDQNNTPYWHLSEHEASLAANPISQCTFAERAIRPDPSITTLSGSNFTYGGAYGFGLNTMPAAAYASRTSSELSRSASPSPTRSPKGENRLLRSPRRVVAGSSALDHATHSGASVKSMMKQKLLSKIYKLLSKESSKNPSKESNTSEVTATTRKRTRSSQSSTISNYEPMPTITEENESDVDSLHSTIHRLNGTHFGTPISTHIIDAAA
jgi:hypothetical protein